MSDNGNASNSNANASTNNNNNNSNNVVMRSSSQQDDNTDDNANANADIDIVAEDFQYNFSTAEHLPPFYKQSWSTTILDVVMNFVRTNGFLPDEHSDHAPIVPNSIFPIICRFYMPDKTQQRPWVVYTHAIIVSKFLNALRFRKELNSFVRKMRNKNRNHNHNNNSNENRSTTTTTTTTTTATKQKTKTKTKRKNRAQIRISLNLIFECVRSLYVCGSNNSSAVNDIVDVDDDDGAHQNNSNCDIARSDNSLFSLQSHANTTAFHINKNFPEFVRFCRKRQEFSVAQNNTNTNTDTDTDTNKNTNTSANINTQPSILCDLYIVFLDIETNEVIPQLSYLRNMNGRKYGFIGDADDNADITANTNNTNANANTNTGAAENVWPNLRRFSATNKKFERRIIQGMCDNSKEGLLLKAMFNVAYFYCDGQYFTIVRIIESNELGKRLLLAMGYDKQSIVMVFRYRFFVVIIHDKLSTAMNDISNVVFARYEMLFDQMYFSGLGVLPNAARDHARDTYYVTLN